MVATIGSHTFTAIVDANNDYELKINVPNKDINQPFSTIATGAGSDRWVKLAALYPSIGKLTSLAGDKTLDASEYIGVNISPSTTAEYAIIQINRSPVNTDTDRKYALLQIDAADKLNRAAYLVRLLTDINTNMPPQFPTTLDLVLDKFYIGGQININNEYEDSLNFEREAIKGDSLQSFVSKKAIVGRYLLRAGSFSYLVTFNAAGTGLLRTSNTPGVGIWPGDGKYHEASFTWIRKQEKLEITLDTPLSYGKTIGFNNTFQSQCANSSSGVSVPACSVTLHSLLLSLIDENEVGKITDVYFVLNVTDATNQHVFDASGISYTATLLDVSQFYKVAKDELSGNTWYTNNYSYKFNADGTATQVNLYTKNSTPVNWQLDNGRVTLDGDALEILPLYAQGPGLVVMQLLKDNERALSNGAFQQTSFFKRERVTMAEADWVGRWNRGFENYFSAASDFYANKKFRDGFETQLMGAWTVVDGSRMWALSNGGWRSEYDVLAIKDGQYYLQNCYGENTVNFVPTGCVVESYVIDKTFTGTTFWENWSNPLFENMATGDYWQFWGHSLYVYDGNYHHLRSIKKMAPNLFLDVFNWKILEMLSSGINAIEVCEYNVGDTCNASDSFTLARTPEIKFNISGSGLIRYETRDFQTSGSMMVRKEAKSLFLQPATGQEVLPNNISGCGGNLNGNFYEIPAPQADCEITVTFTPY